MWVNQAALVGVSQRLFMSIYMLTTSQVTSNMAAVAPTSLGFTRDVGCGGTVHVPSSLV